MKKNNRLSYLQGLFDPHKEIDKYNLDDSTFDLINIKRFYNSKASTVFSYLLIWILMILSWVLLGVDIYTCLNILVFHRWSNDDYKPYAYAVAKWIFTGCIIFQFLLLIYHWIWAIHTFRTKNIALTYVNGIARLLYVVKSYNYHCLFHQIEQDNFFDWSCFLSYSELDNALQILVADTPRQVINVLTLRYYATDGDSLNDIISNIKKIATSNLRLSIILSFMCLSVAIWSIFLFKFMLGMILYIPVVVKLRGRGYKSLKKYCCDVVNDNVRKLVSKNHKSKKTLLEEGVIDIDDIANNPLLSSSTTTFNNDFEYKSAPDESNGILKPSAIHKVGPDYGYNDNFKLYNQKMHNQTYESLPLDDFSGDTFGKSEATQPYIPSHRQRAYNHNNSSYSVANPFSDVNKATSKDNLMFARTNRLELGRKAPPVERNPFDDDETHQVNEHIIDSYNVPMPFIRKHSQSSLTSTSYDPPSVIVNEYSDSSLNHTKPPATSDLENDTPYPIRGVSMYGSEQKNDHLHDKLLNEYDDSDKDSSQNEEVYREFSQSSNDDDNNWVYNRN